MEEASGPYQIIKLHNRDERCWGVVDERGALLNFNGLSMRMTKLEAQVITEDRNRRSSDRQPPRRQGQYTVNELTRIEARLEVSRLCIESQQSVVVRLDDAGLDSTAARKLLSIFRSIFEQKCEIRNQIVDYFHLFPDARMETEPAPSPGYPLD